MRIFVFPYAGCTSLAPLLQRNPQLDAWPLPQPDAAHKDVHSYACVCAKFIAAHATRDYVLLGLSLGSLAALETAFVLERDYAPTSYLGPSAVIVCSHDAPWDIATRLIQYSRFSIQDLRNEVASWLGSPELAESLPVEALQTLRHQLVLGEEYIQTHPERTVACPIVSVYGSLDDLQFSTWSRHSTFVPSQYLTRPSFETSYSLADGQESWQVEYGPLDHGCRRIMLQNASHMLFTSSMFWRTLLPRIVQQTVECSLTIHGLYVEMANANLTKPILYDAHVGGWLTYAALNELIFRVMTFLEKHPQQIVAPMLPKGALYVATCLATMMSGKWSFPLESHDLAQLLAGSDVDALHVSESDLAHCLADFCPQDASRVLRRRSQFEDSRGIAFLVYSSGSTGTPKMITVLHANHVLSYHKRRDLIPFVSNDVEGCNIFFLWEVFRPLIYGVPAVTIPETTITDTRRFQQQLCSLQVTRIQLTPSMARLLASAVVTGNVEPYSSITALTLCGEVVRKDLFFMVRQAFPRAAVFNVYSISEVSEVCICDLTTDPLWATSLDAAPIGHAMEGVVVKLVEGELWIGGPHLGDGYLGQAEKTAERFVKDPESKEWFYRTGDAAYLSNSWGYVVTGRCDFNVRVRGYTVDTNAVAQFLISFSDERAVSVSCVKECIVMGRKHGDDHVLEAHIVFAPGHPSVGADKLRAFLADKVPPYAIPIHWLYYPGGFAIDPATGKTDRKALRALRGAARCPRVSQPEARRIAPPRGDSIIARQFLEIIRAETGCDDADWNHEWSALGGHSLVSMKVLARIQRELNAPGASISPLLQLSMTLADIFAEIFPPEQSVDIIASSTNVLRPTAAADLICVAGMSVMTPTTRTLEEFWSSVVSDRPVQKYPYQLPTEEMSLGLSPEIYGTSLSREWMDPSHSIAVRIALETLIDSRLPIPEDLRLGRPIAVVSCTYFPSAIFSDSQSHLLASGKIDLAGELGFLGDYISSRIAHVFDLRGPAIGVQSSCSSSLTAISVARALLLSMPWLEGALIISSSVSSISPADPLSPSGRVRPLDAAADGTLFCDAAAGVFLARFSSFPLDMIRAYATVKAVAVNQDGRCKDKMSFLAPSVSGIRELLEQHPVAQLWRDVDYVELHGTATVVGDPIECQALLSNVQSPKIVGSAKATFGHGNIAAGLLGFAKACLVLYKRTIPPLQNFSEPNPVLSPLIQHNKLIIPCAKLENHDVRLCAVSCLGVGGTNALAIVERADQYERIETTQDERTRIWKSMRYGWPKVKKTLPSSTKLVVVCPGMNAFASECLSASRTVERCVLMHSLLAKSIPSHTDLLFVGHSLGDFSALVCAGMLSLQTCFAVLTAREHAIAERSPPGVMYAYSSTVQALGGYLACINSPAQVVRGYISNEQPAPGGVLVGTVAMHSPHLQEAASYLGASGVWCEDWKWSCTAVPANVYLSVPIVPGETLYEWVCRHMCSTARLDNAVTHLKSTLALDKNNDTDVTALELTARNVVGTAVAQQLGVPLFRLCDASHIHAPFAFDVACARCAAYLDSDPSVPLADIHMFAFGAPHRQVLLNKPATHFSSSSQQSTSTDRVVAHASGAVMQSLRVYNVDFVSSVSAFDEDELCAEEGWNGLRRGQESQDRSFVMIDAGKMSRGQLLRTLYACSNSARVVVYSPWCTNVFQHAVVMQERCPHISVLRVITSSKSGDAIDVDRLQLSVAQNCNRGTVEFGDVALYDEERSMLSRLTYSLLHDSLQLLSPATASLTFDVVIITGASGALGCLLSSAISAQHPAVRLICTSRSQGFFPHMETAWSSLFASIDSKSRICVLHCAGLADLTMFSPTMSDVEVDDLYSREAQPKGEALRALLATAPRGCRIVLFSSLAAHIGGPGMTFYGAANAEMEEIVYQMRSYIKQHALEVACIAWDDWAVMPKHTDKRMQIVERKGPVNGISSDEGVRLVLRAMSIPMRNRCTLHWAVSAGDLHVRRRDWVTEIGTSQHVAGVPVPRFGAVPGTGHTTVSALVQRQLNMVMGTSAVDIAAKFTDICDSLAAVRLSGSLSRALSEAGYEAAASRVSVKLIFDSPSLASLIKSIEE